MLLSYLCVALMLVTNWIMLVTPRIIIELSRCSGYWSTGVSMELDQQESASCLRLTTRVGA
jgi:hypothetical protein